MSTVARCVRVIGSECSNAAVCPSNSEMCTRAVKSQENFYTIVELSEGEHQYKFLVDGTWRHSDHSPTVDNKMGSLNNLVVVRASDFEVPTSLLFSPLMSSSITFRYIS